MCLRASWLQNIFRSVAHGVRRVRANRVPARMLQQTFKEGDCVLERAAAFEFFHALLGDMKRIIGVRAPGVGELEDGHAHN